MPKLSANNYRVYIESATPGAFNEVAGQISVTVDRGEVNFSNIDKASTVETTARAMRNYAVSMEYRPDLPDTNGHTRLETLFANGAANGVQVRKSPFAGGDVVFACSMRVGAMNFGSPLNDVNTINATFASLAAPSTDLLA
jgi:hypothetical protein